MNWLDCVNLGCTVVSVLSAIGSAGYWRKSRNVTKYSKTNSAYIETNNILNALTDLIKLSNTRIKRGKNYEMEIADKAIAIRNAINTIRGSIPTKDFKDIDQLLTKQFTNVPNYIDDIITGKYTTEEGFKIDDEFKKSQEAFYKIQECIKRKLEKAEEKLK